MSDDFSDEPVSFDVTGREVLGQGRFLTLLNESLDYNGVAIRREFVDHPGAVGVVVLDDEDRVLTIRQYRHAIRTRSWEVPAGLLDVVGESLLTAAQRELAEEADLVAASWNVLLDITPSPGMSNESIRIFLARGLTPTTAPHPRAEEEADIELRWMPLDEVVSAALGGRIRNAILIAGVLAAADARNHGWANLREAIAS